VRLRGARASRDGDSRGQKWFLNGTLLEGANVKERPMKRLLFSVMCVLVLAGSAVASKQPKEPSSPAKSGQGKVIRLNASQIFDFVEHAQKDPKADRARAEEFLQSLLDGKERVRPTSCVGKLCQKDQDCRYPGGFCAGGSVGGRLCLQL
jgi:hypothetical protein